MRSADSQVRVLPWGSWYVVLFFLVTLDQRIGGRFFRAEVGRTERVLSSERLRLSGRD